MTNIPELLVCTRTLLAEATPGPWRSRWEEIGEGVEPEDEAVIVAPGGPVLGIVWYDGPHVLVRHGDAALIAAAPCLLADLAAEVERLRAGLAILAGRVKLPPPPPEALPIGAFGSAGAAMIQASVEAFAGDLLDGRDGKKDKE